MSYKQMTGNIISATKVEPVGTSEVGAASGVWNLDDVYDYKRGANWPEAGVPDPDTFIENVFSTTLYTGDESTNRDIVNNINLSGDGGLVWTKNRDSGSYGNNIFDTVRGATKMLITNRNNAEADEGNTLTQFNNNGFRINADNNINKNNEKYVSWTFKKAFKFFDIVTYEGTGSARTVAHSLGGTVGMILVKNRDQTDSWAVYHRGADDSAPEDYDLHLNTNVARSNTSETWNDTAPTSSVFTVGTSHMTNADGENYVAYLFAHDAGADSMIKCDKFTGSAQGEVTVDLGFEPQFLMIKNRQSADNWHVYDTMRGYFAPDADGIGLEWDTKEAETTDGALGGHPNASGFATDGDGPLNAHTYIYMAIRRPNMATITDATEVFSIYNNSSDTTEPVFRTSPEFPVDYAWFRDAPGGGDTIKQAARLIGPVYLNSTSNASEASLATVKFDYQNGWRSTGGSGQYSWMWKRAKGYFDVVAYTGDGEDAHNLSHGLGVTPEMMWVKRRDNTDIWVVYTETTGNGGFLRLNDTNTLSSTSVSWNNTSPTSSVFTVGNYAAVNTNNSTYIAFLFATLAGVSKVGSVTHSGSSTDVDCGFSAGAKFVLLKRTDAAGDWFFWDSVRGIIAGNDSYLLVNTDAAAVTNTDYIDPLASGFQISGSFQDGDYIFYAIA